MDPLTEKLLERARARRENLAKKMAESNMSPRKTMTRIPLQENQSQNKEVIPSYSDRKPVSPAKSRLQVHEIKPDTPAIPSVKSRLQRLADQRKQWDATGTEIDSPKNVLPPPRYEPEEIPQPTKPAQNSTRSRFAALAASINSWEDDTNHPKHYPRKETPKTRTWQPPKPVESTPEPSPVPAKRAAPQNTTEADVSAPSTQPSPPKRKKYEENEENNPKVGSQQPSGKVGVPNDPGTEDNTPIEHPVPAPRVTRTTEAVSTQAEARSPVKMQQVSASPIKRPVLQSCTAAVPKIQSPKKQTVRESPQKKQVQSPKKHTVRESPQKKQAPFKKSPVKQASPKKQITQKRAPIQRRGATSENFARARALLEQGCNGGRASSNVVTSPTRVEPRVGAMAKKIQDRLKEHETRWQSNEINRKAQEERQKELSLIKSRWEYPRSGSPEQEREASSEPKSQKEEDIPEPEDEEYDEEDYEEEEEEEEDDLPEEAMEDVETNTDDSTTEEDDKVAMHENKEEEEEETDGRVEKQVVEEKEEEADESEMNISDVLGDIDELIVVAEQAMREEQAKANSLERETTPANSSQANSSGWDYDIENTESLERHTSSSSVSSAVNPTPAPRNKRQPSSASSDSSSSSQVTPHSLESYRTQQKESMSPVVVTHRTVTREATPVTRSASGSCRQEAQRSQNNVEKAKRVSTRDKIQALMEDVAAQQSIIHQTSQALELIAATEEYHGTKEEIEAEKLLVIATQRRQACLAEIQHLKNPMTPVRVIVTEDGGEITPCRGSVTIKDIRLPLKTQYLMALDSGRDQAHHSYFVIVRCHEHVIATQLLSTRDVRGDCIHFTNMVCLNDLGSDFTIEMLVYEMRGRCPTMDAVHGKKTSKQGLLSSLTPKKKFKTSMSSVRQGGRYPPVSSSGGPSTVRQNSFATVGSVRLTLASCQLRKVTLSKVPFLSPLEGTIHMSMSCHTDSKTHADGFLTMFDESSGLGMWHRRWCVLNGGYLSFWKYPGDEKRKPPIGSIILKECITKEVRLISRIHCARPNTFELQTSAPSSNSERDTPAAKRNNSETVTKHLLSADTKEDRIQWTTALNKTLLELRLWCKDAARPKQE